MSCTVANCSGCSNKILPDEPELMNGPEITIWFTDGDSHTIVIDLRDPDGIQSWSIKKNGLVFHYQQRGKRVIYPWHNIINYLVEPRTYIAGGSSGN